MTVGTHIAEIIRQGIWASLTGGWYYEPTHSTLCNTVHLYIWLVLLVLPLLLGLITSGTYSLYLMVSYAVFVSLLFTVVKLIVSYLHRVFDTTEPIVMTKSKPRDETREDLGTELSPSNDLYLDQDSANGQENLDPNTFEMVDMASAPTVRPVARLASSSDSERATAIERPETRRRVRIDTQDMDIHQVDIHVETENEQREDNDFSPIIEEETPLMEECSRKRNGESVSLEDVRVGRLTRKTSEPALDIHWRTTQDRRSSEGGSQRVRRANSTVEGRSRTKKSKSGGMLSEASLEQCRENTRKSYPMKISSTDEFLHGGNLKRSDERQPSSSVSISAADDSKAISSGSTTDNNNTLAQQEEGKPLDTKSEYEEECQPSTSKIHEKETIVTSSAPDVASSSSGWNPVVVVKFPDNRPSTTSLHRANERIVSQDELPGTSEPSGDLKGEITRFLEDLIDKHPETLDAIESVRMNRMGRAAAVRNSHVAHPHAARWSGSRRASQTVAISALSNLAARDGTHIAQGHEDTSQGAVHSFQDEDGNWWTYAFDESGRGTAQALGSGRALMELLQSNPLSSPPRQMAPPLPPHQTPQNHTLDVLPESAYASSEDEENEKEREKEVGDRGGNANIVQRRSRAPSSSSNESQVYIATAPSTVFHAPSSAVARNMHGGPAHRAGVPMQRVSLASISSRLHAALQRSEEQGVRPAGESRMNIIENERERGLFELEQRLLRLDSTGSSSHSSRFRFLADLGLTTPSLTLAPTTHMPLNNNSTNEFGAIRRPSSAKKAYYYSLKVLPKSDKSFKLKLDRLSLSALFDRNRSFISAVCDVTLACLVSLLAGVVISQAIFHDISLVAFAFVVAGAHFSLLKSVQPDASSPIHGFNWLVAYSRPVYFCVLCSFLLWLNYAANDPNNDKVPWNWNMYRWFDASWDSILLSFRDLVATFVLLMPIAFTFGWLPQVNTLLLHILEQVEMHIFGGTACISVLSAVMQIAKSLSVCGILGLITHFALQADPTSTQTVVFSALSAAAVSLSFMLSRLPSNPRLLTLTLSNWRCLFGYGVTSQLESDTSSQHSGARLLCTARHKQQSSEVNVSDDWSSPDPLPAQVKSSLLLRCRHDLLFAILIALVVFALHSTSMFSATKPYFTIVVASITIVVGAVNHYLYMQLRAHTPWKLVAKPILRPYEFGQFESPNAARLMLFEWVHVWSGAVERNLLYPLLVISILTESALSLPFPIITIPLFTTRILRGGFCAPQMMFVPLALSFLLVRVDWRDHVPFGLPEGHSSADLFPCALYILAVIYPKWIELYLKLSFVLAYVAPWQISWGSAFHAFAQPFSVPHSGLVWLQTVISSILSAPLNPFLGSSFFTTSYVRPVKFWERDYNTKRSDASNTRLAAQIDRGPMMDDSNLNAVFYEHLTRSLQTYLAGDIRMGRWATSVQPGDCFILASFYLNCLVHIIEVGNGFVTFQLRGLEFRGTYCHQREVEAISEDTSEGAGCCCCSPGSLPGMLSLNTAWALRWLAWEVTSSKYIIEGYSITDNSAVNLLQVHELRRLLVTLYVKCIIYFTLKSERLCEWFTNETILSALEPIESNPRYVDVDHMFCSANDEDYDVNNMGISRQSFSDLYSSWITFCTQKRNDGELETIPPDSPLSSLCMALSLLGRRALGAASYNRHSNAAESFLYGLHALFKGDFRVTCSRDEWVFADMDLLRCVIAPSVRMALKLHQDHFAAADDFDDPSAMFDLIEQHQENLFISHEHDPGWRRAILSNTPSLLALRHIYDDGQDDYKIIMLNKMHLNMRVIKLNRECVRAFWAGQQQELIFLRNRNPERGSIQNARQVLRNMINSSADQPVGYPIYVSPLTTSFVETHPQISRIQGTPLTAEGIAGVARCAWKGLRSHFGTSGSSSLGPASCGGASTAATAGSQAPLPSNLPLRPPLIGESRADRESRDSQMDADRLSSGSSQPEQSVVSMCMDGSARVSLCRIRSESTPPPQRRVQLAIGRHSVPPNVLQREGMPAMVAESEIIEECVQEPSTSESTIFVEISDVEQIFKCLDEPLKATGEPLVVWPKESWRVIGGRSAWDWMPLEGWMGQVVHCWMPNHPLRALRSHIGGKIYLVSLFDMPSALVPIGEKGVRVISRREAELSRGGSISPPLLPDNPPTLREVLDTVGVGSAYHTR